MKMGVNITEDEAALYDRQIRLWGVDAQKKLLSSRILLIQVKGLGAEIAKNLALSGINSLTLIDADEVTDCDLKTNFLLNQTSHGKNRAESCVESLQILNPMVKINADSSSVYNKEDSFFSNSNFDLVCALIDDNQLVEKLSNLSRKNNFLFISGYTYGLYGFMFVDFNEFQFISEAKKILEDGIEKKSVTNRTNAEKEKQSFEERNIKFKSFSDCLMSFTAPLENLTKTKLKRLSKTYFIVLLINTFFEKHKRSVQIGDKNELKSIKNELFEKFNCDPDLLSDSIIECTQLNELASINAIMGGVIAQEIIKAISKKNEPTENFFLFDGNQMTGEIIKI